MGPMVYNWWIFHIVRFAPLGMPSNETARTSLSVIPWDSFGKTLVCHSGI